MRGAKWVASVAVALALGALVLAAIGVWPTETPLPPSRADLRPGLASRHAVDQGSTHTADLPADARSLTAERLCARARRATPRLLSLPEGPGLVVPCGDALEVWALADDPPARLAQVQLGEGELGLRAALAHDLDGDGSVDWLLALSTEQARPLHREGLYWVRGREEGGYLAPRRIAPGRVDALAAGTRAGASGLWVARSEPPPASRAVLWWIPAGAAPARAAQWVLPHPARALTVLRGAEAGPGSQSSLLVGLWEQGLWTLGEDAGGLREASVSFAGGRLLTRVDGALHVGSEEGLARVRIEDGALSLAPADGPRAPEAVAALPSGLRLALSDGTVFAFRPGGPVQALSAVGGGHVEHLLQDGQAVWLWLSGLSAPRGVGVLRISDPWPPVGPTQVAVQLAEERPFPARLRVP